MDNADQVMRDIKLNLAFNAKQSVVGACFLLVVGVVAVYCAAQIGGVVRDYLRSKQELADRRSTAVAGKNPLLNPANDDVAANSSSSGSANNVDESEYTQISVAIKQQLAAYKAYNQQLENYYRGQQGKDHAPDQIDQRILDPSNDDWEKD